MDLLKNTPVIFVPETSAGKGTGHLKRCLGFARDLPNARFFLPQVDGGRLLAAFPELSSFPLLDAPPPKEELSAAVVILDRPFLVKSDVLPWMDAFRLVALDPRGPGSVLVPGVFDLLPRLKKLIPTRRAQSNRALPDLLFSKKKGLVQPDPGSDLSIAVSFGGEDPSGLRRSLMESGLIQSLLPHARVALVRGPASPALDCPLPPGWEEIGPFPSLEPVLPSFDFLITSFGLTALEARAWGIPQVHLNPTAYHQKLSIQEGFPILGLIKPHRRSREVLEELTASWPQSRELRALADESQPPQARIADVLEELVRGSSHACPACTSRGNSVLARYPDRSFFVCSSCGITYQSLLVPQPVEYSEAYFFEDYQKQYGRTYLEDFEHIKSMGKSRASQIARFIKPHESTLLDIGCAFGPFMAAAKDLGFTPKGCDINPQAVAYITETLGMEAWALDFRNPSVRLDPPVFDAVTLWYVIEHFESLEPVLARLAQLLKTGGILALSTPSGQGISARARLGEFLDRSPKDHYTIWNPSRTRGLLARHGFELLAIRSTGHHPERFPGILGKPVFRSLSLLLSRIFGLGDTFELYARKTGPGSSGTSGASI